MQESAHAVARVEGHRDGALVAAVKGGPAATALKFCRGRVEWLLARPARKVALASLRQELGVLTLVRHVGALATDDVVLLWREDLAPLVLTLADRCKRRIHLRFERIGERVIRVDDLWLRRCRLFERGRAEGAEQAAAAVYRGRS